MKRRIKEKISNIEVITPDFSINVIGVGGPVIETEFLKVVEFTKLIIEQLKR